MVVSRGGHRLLQGGRTGFFSDLFTAEAFPTARVVITWRVGHFNGEV